MKLKLAVAIALLAVACGSVDGTGGGGPVGSPLTIDQLKFKVMDAVGVPLFCDPDYYPIARAGGEEASADTYYPQIKADPELYSAIVAHEHLPSGDLDEPAKLTLYQAFKRLRALVLTQNGDSYTFEIRVQSHHHRDLAQAQRQAAMPDLPCRRHSDCDAGRRGPRH